MDPLINADFTKRIVFQTADLPWLSFPQAGADRRMLDRIGGEVGRAAAAWPLNVPMQRSYQS